MKDIAEKIGEVVAESLAAKQAEVEALLEKVRSDIDSLQRALSTFSGTAGQADAKRAPSPDGRRRRRKTPTAEKAGDLADGIEQDAGEAYAPGEDTGRAVGDLAADDGVLAEAARRESRQQGLTYGATSNTSM